MYLPLRRLDLGLLLLAWWVRHGKKEVVKRERDKDEDEDKIVCRGIFVRQGWESNERKEGNSGVSKR